MLIADYVEPLTVDFRYQVSYPLEHSRPTAVYAVTDRWESDNKKVLTLLDVPGVGEIPTEVQAELGRAFEVRHSIKHPLLAPISDLATRGNRLGIISEFIEGTPFSGELPAMTWQLQLDIAFKLVQLFAFLHEREFVIGYLDPTKLFWSSNNQVKVNLLLAARRFREDTPAGQGVRYWAPEYLLDRKASQEADVYSLGMNLYLLFTGVPPFSESDPGILAQKQMVAEPLRPQKLNTSIPDRLDSLIRGMTQKSHKARPSAGEVRTLLAEEMNKDVVLVAPLTSHLVGRETEARRFRGILLRHQESPSVRFVTLCGSSGIGKTALAQSFENAARIAGYRTFSLHHHPNTNACAPFRALIGKLSLEAYPGDEAVGGFVEGGNPEVRTVIKQLVDLVVSLSESGPLLIRATDLQWMDEGSFEAYRRLATLTGCRLLILADLRTDEQLGYWEELSIELREADQLTEISVGPLTQDDELLLTRNLIGSIHSEKFLNELSRVCQGVPFFVYEFLRNLQQNGELRYRKGAWTWEPDDTDGRVPETVAENLNTRLDRLRSYEQSLLECLSVLDRAISVEVLARIQEIPISEIITLVERLEKLDFVTIEGTLADPVTELKHAWLAQTIRTRLSSENRRAHHLRIATCLEKDYLEAPEPFLAETLTRHFLGARSGEKTMQYIWIAVDYLRTGGLYRHASLLVEKASAQKVLDYADPRAKKHRLELLYLSGNLEGCIEMVNRLLATANGANERAFLHSFLARILAARGENSRAVTHLERALTYVDSSKDPNLLPEILGELTGSLSCIGARKRARAAAARLIRGIRARALTVSKDKLYHSLYLYCHFVQDPLSASALSWELRSIKMSLGSGNFIRSGGRAFNIGSTLLKLGFWDSGRRITALSQQIAEETGNRELGIYAQTNIAIELRKKGRHKEAVSVLEKALRLNRRLNKNPHLEVEFNIELAKNAVYQLQLGKARTHLDHLSELIQPDEVFSSSADVQLLSGWLWILSGDAPKAEALAEKLRSREIPREAGRNYLLSGQAKLAQHNFTGAMKDATLALQHFPRSAPYYRVRARLLQGEIALQDPGLAKAGPYIRDALRISKEHFYIPLLARAYMLRARWLAHTGQSVDARAHCLRALQVSATVERPMLQAEICSTLGAIETQTRSHEKGIKQLLRASEILRECGRLLPSDVQGTFFASYLEPIEQKLSRQDTNRSQSSSYLLSSVNDFARAVKEVENRGALAKTILRFISREIPGTSVNLYFRSGEDQHFHLAGSIGKCRRSGRQHLQKGKSLREEIQPFSFDGVSVLALFLRSGGSTTGLLYTERSGPVSEAEFDYLNTLKSITDLLPRQGENGQKSPALMVSGLELKDGRTIVGKHNKMRKVFDEVRHLAKSRAIALISGETGTGKELVARAIHDYSSRGNGTYLPINCAAIQRDLIENELFGHGEGSYTGAGKSSKGVFEGASGGTLFLDEVSAMPLDLQTRFLRVLETNRIRRLGEVKERVIDTRIVAATNQNLPELVRTGRFRSDLFHRLNVLQIEIPPLRSRLSDIPTLCSHFLANLNRREDRNIHLTEEALAVLGSYRFPGNVRELKNIVASLYYMADNAITAEAIRSRLTGGRSAHLIDNDQIAEIMDEMASGRANFWQVVWEPFLRRDLSRGDVRRILSLGLEHCGGSYRKLIDYFGVPQNEYKKFLASLSAHDCKVDFRPFRKKKQ